ncbi:MAG TPA: hypothetical protein H9711_03500 [Candidatus Mediterraneibacter intestinavium]|nr:hypothetical protein [Candidatus Mediterraneibacter intestinavium]
MSENRTGRTGGFIGYEYKEVVTDPGQASFLMDGYANFGWEVDENVMPGGLEKYPERAGSPQHRKTVIRLKRDRKIINKMELTRLQRNFEACVSQIDQLEKEKTSRPMAASLTVGILGTAFMAGSTFAVTAEPPMVALCIVLAVPGFLGWILPYFLYRAGVRRQTEKITPLIEEKYDEIYEICEKGNKLLS